MVLLTEILRFEVTDDKGGRAGVADLAVALLEDDYPPVTGLLIHGGHGIREIAWKDVFSIDPKQRTIHVSDVESALDAQSSTDVLLKRDILDSLILDLLGRRTTRVCDLVLETENDAFRLKGADAGMGAMLRRVFFGRWIRLRRDSIFDWKYVEFLRGDPVAVDNGAGYRLRINRLPAGEIARLADFIPYLHAAELLKLLPDDKAADVLEAMPIERQVQIIEELDEQQAVGLISRMSPELATDLVGRLELEMMRRYMGLLPEKQRNRVIELLRFPEDSVGGAMTNDIVALAVDMDCGSARSQVECLLDEVRFSTIVFIVDDEKHRCLRGSINLRELLSADASQPLEASMDPYLQKLAPFDDAIEAAYRIVGGQLPAMPVVDENARLIGAMTVEAAIARLLPATSSLQRLKVFS